MWSNPGVNVQTLLNLVFFHGHVWNRCRRWRSGPWSALVAVFPQAAVGVEVVGLGALALDAGSVHVSRAGDLVLRVTPAAQAGLEAVLELFADKVEDNGVYAGVYGG